MLQPQCPYVSNHGQISRCVSNLSFYVNHRQRNCHNIHLSIESSAKKSGSSKSSLNGCSIELGSSSVLISFPLSNTFLWTLPPAVTTRQPSPSITSAALLSTPSPTSPAFPACGGTLSAEYLIQMIAFTERGGVGCQRPQRGGGCPPWGGTFLSPPGRKYTPKFFRACGA